ncbi:MAG: ABC transporter permease [Aggregatilineales bacterium]
MQGTIPRQHIIESSTLKRKQALRSRQPIWKYLRRLMPLLTFGVILGLWQLVTVFELYPTFIIPPPATVAESFMEVAQDGRLWLHTQITLEEVLKGLFFGVMTGTILGYAIAKNRMLEEVLSPIIVAFQSAPTVAYAPLLIIWFGTGVESKIVTSAIIVFFPTMMNTIVGIRNVPQNLRDVMRSLRASPLKMFWYLELPAALPVLLTGLKTAATLAVIGAVVGEFVGARQGLGVLVTLARNQYDTPLVYVAVLTMTAMALTLYLSVSLMEWLLLSWQRKGRR